MSSSSTIERVTESFPYKSLPPVIGQPCYETIKATHLKLNECMISVHSNNANGMIGHLGVSEEAPVIATISNVPWVAPINPGPAPVIPVGAQGPQIANIRRTYDEDRKKFNVYQACLKAGNALLVGCFDTMFLEALAQPTVGLAMVTPLQLLRHLYTQYANITAADLAANDVAMKTPYDVNMPIENLYKQIQSAVEFATAGSTPYSPAQVLAVAYQLVFQTGIFADDCKIWKRRPANYKTWLQFKIDFTISHQEYRESQVTTPAAAGFNASAPDYAHLETIDAITNLATATAADQTAVANLTTTNATLTAELVKAKAKLVTALEKIAALTSRLGSGGGAATPRTGIGSASSERKHYCHTHGFRCTHCSWDCPDPGEQHEKRATARNQMGGCQKNKPE